MASTWTSMCTQYSSLRLKKVSDWKVSLRKAAEAKERLVYNLRYALLSLQEVNVKWKGLQCKCQCPLSNLSVRVWISVPCKSFFLKNLCEEILVLFQVFSSCSWILIKNTALLYNYFRVSRILGFFCIKSPQKHI